MAKITHTVADSAAEQAGSFPISLTKEAFQAAVVDVCLHYIRTIAYIADEKAAWGVLSLPVPDGASVFDPDDSARELGLTYEHIRNIAFARAMEYLYEFAFFGRRDENAETMFYESYYMWVSDLACDAARGYVALEWDSYGGAICDSARKCVQVAELANARNTLEGGESFFNSFPGSSAKDETVDDGSLTIRQMSLLSGMEEMSVRAAANPKRANPLQTHKEAGGTRIAFDVAKTWLQSTGRYVPITRYWSDGDIDLAKRRFSNSRALIDALNARRETITLRDGAQELNDRLGALGIPVEKEIDRNYWNIDEPHLRDEGLMRNLAELLDLPSDLLILRAKEVLTIQQLSQIERQLREATLVTTKTSS